MSVKSYFRILNALRPHTFVSIYFMFVLDLWVQVLWKLRSKRKQILEKGSIICFLYQCISK